MSVSTISNREMGNATGLFNMLRNIGGSIGIAVASTALIRRADQHQTYMSANLSPSSAALQQKSAMIAAYLGTHIGRPARAPAPSACSTASCSSKPPCGLCGCLSLDSGPGSLLRRRSLALQKAFKARRPAAGSALTKRTCERETPHRLGQFGTPSVRAGGKEAVKVLLVPVWQVTGGSAAHRLPSKQSS